MDRFAHIETQYLAKHVMVTASELVCGKDITDACQVLRRRLEFNIVPIKDNGKIVSYIERGRERSLKKIDLYHDVIGDGTSVLRLFDILSAREFCFVLSENHISGYIHFSDLNNRLINIALFNILTHYEGAIAELLSRNICERDLKDLMTDRQIARLKDVRDRNSDLDWTTPLFFGEIIALAQRKGLVHISQEQLHTMKDGLNP